MHQLCAEQISQIYLKMGPKRKNLWNIKCRRSPDKKKAVRGLVKAVGSKFFGVIFISCLVGRY